jgi:hypothetical protein
MEKAPLEGEVLDRPAVNVEAQQVPVTVDMGALVGLTRAEIDTQIATARQYPRSITHASEEIRGMAVLTPRVAQSMVYALPRGSKTIEGPSIRLAEVISQQWGNCRVSSRVVAVDRKEGYIEAEGIYHDLQTNAAWRSNVRRRILDKNGRVYNEDMIVMTGNAACSIARRNAILGGVPQAVWLEAYEEALKVITGTAGTLDANRKAALDYIKEEFNVEREKVFAALGVEGIDDIGLKQVRVLRGIASALKNEEITIEEAFSSRAQLAHEKVPDPLKDDGAGPSTTAQAGTVAATSTAADTKGGGKKGKAAATGTAKAEPKAPGEYRAHAVVMIENALDAALLRAWWKNDLGLRNACGVTAEDRKPLEEALEAKCIALGEKKKK